MLNSLCRSFGPKKGALVKNGRKNHEKSVETLVLFFQVMQGDTLCLTCFCPSISRDCSMFLSQLSYRLLEQIS